MREREREREQMERGRNVDLSGKRRGGDVWSCYMCDLLLS